MKRNEMSEEERRRRTKREIHLHSYMICGPLFIRARRIIAINHRILFTFE